MMSGEHFTNSMKPRFQRLAVTLLAALIMCAPGCAWMRKQIAGEGFQGWSNDMGKASGVANKDGEKPKHSGYFTDTKAQQIEEHLGGGFNSPDSL